MEQRIILPKQAFNISLSGLKHFVGFWCSFFKLEFNWIDHSEFFQRTLSIAIGCTRPKHEKYQIFILMDKTIHIKTEDFNTHLKKYKRFKVIKTSLIKTSLSNFHSSNHA